MSWWIYLGKKKTAKVKRHSEGGTRCMGGTEDAELNVTWNYGKFYHQWFDKEKGLKWLDNKMAKETIPRLEAAIKFLGKKPSTSYWDANPGNAGYALSILLEWAKQHPRAKWIVR